MININDSSLEDGKNCRCNECSCQECTCGKCSCEENIEDTEEDTTT